MLHDSEFENTGVYAPEVLEFARLANEFCIWLEESDQLKALDFIKQSVTLLPGIYHQIMLLKETEPLLEGGNEKFVTEHDWSSIYQKVLLLLGEHNGYLRLADSEEYDRSDLVTHTISEDMADIYQDLKDFTRQYRQGMEEIMNDAVWEVTSSFEQFWGAKLLNALRAIHILYVNRTDPQRGSEGELPDESDGENNPTYDNSFFTRLQDLNEEEI